MLLAAFRTERLISFFPVLPPREHRELKPTRFVLTLKNVDAGNVLIELAHVHGCHNCFWRTSRGLLSRAGPITPFASSKSINSAAREYPMPRTRWRYDVDAFPISITASSASS